MTNVVKMPPGWGNDPLSKMLEDAHTNGYHTFVHYPQVFMLWTTVNDTYVMVQRELRDQCEDEWFGLLFLSRSHASWAAAVRLASAGQLPESYMLLRGCLENAMTGLFVSDKSQSTGTATRAETFLRRDEDEETKRKMKKEFHLTLMLKHVAAKDQEVGKVAKQLYEWAIGNGAHPNPSGLLTNMAIEKEAGRTDFQTTYFNDDSVARGLCWKICANVGICSLEIFRLLLPDKFAVIGATARLLKLRSPANYGGSFWKTAMTNRS